MAALRSDTMAWFSAWALLLISLDGVKHGSRSCANEAPHDPGQATSGQLCRMLTTPSTSKINFPKTLYLKKWKKKYLGLMLLKCFENMSNKQNFSYSSEDRPKSALTFLSGFKYLLFAF